MFCESNTTTTTAYSKTKWGGIIFSIKTRIFAVIFIFISLVAVFSAYLSGIVKPIIVKHCKTYASRLIEAAISEAISDAAENGLYKSPMNFIYNSDGNISAYASDMNSVASLRAYISEYILKDTGSNKSFVMKINLGTLSGIPFLYGKGYALSVKISSLSYLSFDVSSEFTDSGINQTLHKIVLTVTTDFMIEEPLDCGKIKIHTSLPLSETVIIGDVPDAYTVIIRAQEEDEADINDYAASVD